MCLLRTTLCAFLMIICVNFLYANEDFVSRKDVQAFIHEMNTAYHFDKKELAKTLGEAQFQPKIIESMNRPYEQKTWDVYKALFLTSNRVEAGLEFWQANQKALEQAQEQFHVPASVIVAIIGVETLYGKHQGNYRVLDALTTLAFHYPKRADFFRKELREFLLLCREQGVPATQYMGSYAGAIGVPQFMPSSYRFYAVNFAGKGKVDLMNENRDVISSVANYFHQHGWKLNEEVAHPAIVRGSRYHQLSTNTKIADYPFETLLSKGVRPNASLKNHPKKAGLIQLLTQKGQEYWVAYPNFYVITRYNTSPQYALVVHLLSQQLKELKESQQQVAQARS